MSLQLRDYQLQCKEEVRAAISQGHKKLACVLPTGSGKTTVFGSIIKDYCEMNPNKKAIVVSHLGLLTVQTAERFESEWGIKSGVLQADRYPTKQDQCVITTMQSFREEGKMKNWARNLNMFCTNVNRLDVGLIIIDECHYAGSYSYQTIISRFPDAYILGFTATPFRQNKLMTNIFDKVAYTVSMQELIDKGFLVPPILHETPFNPNDAADMVAKIMHIYDSKHKGEKAVIYLKTIEEAEIVRDVLSADGYKVSAITSKLTGPARDDTLRKFKNNDPEGPQILTTVDVLTAGFDSPNLTTIFMPYKVGSVTTYLQRVGRGLRPNPGKTHCDIYVGSKSPGIEDGFWQDITKKMLNQGRTDYDNLLDILEFGENDYSVEQYNWTMDVVNMAKAARSIGMENLFEMIVTQELPDDMLKTLVDYPPVSTNWKKDSPASDAQIGYLKSLNLYKEGMTKKEASAILDAHSRLTGKRDERDYVKSGKHTGKHFSQVPPMYWAVIGKKAPNSPVYRDYLEYKKRRRNK